MTLMAVLVGISWVLSRKTLQHFLPFESLLAFGAVALGVVVLFQIDRLG